MTHHRLRCRREAGSALILSIILGFVFLTGIMWFSHWSWNRGRSQQTFNAAQHAYQYADSGVNAVNPWLKSPALLTELPAGATSTLRLTMPNGRCEVALYRQSPVDTSLVDAYATGYYYLPNGTQIDPNTNQHAQMASIHVVYRVNNIREYLLAVPGAQSVSYGISASSGIIYAQSLTFLPPIPNDGSAPPTQVGQVFYSNTLTEPPLPAYIIYHSTPPSAQRLAYAPAFATLDSSTRDFYQKGATAGGTPAFNGSVSPPGDAIFYFVNGDVDIGTAADPLTVNGVWIVYATGSIRIHNSVTTADPNSWAAFLSEQDIHIMDDAPDALALTGNFVCNGNFVADLHNGGVRPAGTLQFIGGIVAMSSMDVATVYKGSKTYTYQYSNNANLVLPNFSDMLQRNTINGAASYK